MLVIPAIDLRGGGVVEPGGEGPGQTEVRFGDPRDIARRWSGYGFSRLHLFDLDAEAGRESNRAAIRDLLADSAAPAQAGGGVQSSDDVDRLFADGASKVIVGARAIEEPDWLREIAEAHPGCVILETVVRDRRVVMRARAERRPRELPRDVLDIIDDLARLALGGLLISAVRGEGSLARNDLQLTEDIVEASEWPVHACGSVSSLTELRALEERGVAGVVIGAALYSGALDPRILVEEFAA